MTTYRRLTPLFQATEYVPGTNEQDILNWVAGLPQLSGEPRDPSHYFSIGENGQLIKLPGSSSPVDFTKYETIPVWTIAIDLIAPIGVCMETFDGPLATWAINFETVAVDSTGLHTA